VVRSTSVPIAELPEPTIRSPSQCSRYCSICDFSRTLADHDLWRYKAFASLARARPGHSQRTPCSQAGRQLAAQRSTALNEKGLVDSFVADAHRLVIREVDRQAPGNLLGAPGFRPPPILAQARPTVFPPDGATSSARAAWRRHDTGKSFLHINAQGRVERKLARLGAAGRSICVPLSGRRPISHSAAVGGGIAIELTGDCRASPPEATPNLPYRMTLRIEKGDLFALRQREIPPRERLCRRSEHRWWNAACLSEQPGADSFGHSSLERSIFAVQPRGNPLPKQLLFGSPRNRRSAQRPQPLPC
jgi:hypothetical protein